VHQFAGSSNGAVSSVIRDSAGNLYRETRLAALEALGRCKVDPTGKEAVSFSGNQLINGGAEPMGGLVMDNAGNLYGTAAARGGAHSAAGTAFKINPAGTITFLVSFCSFRGGINQPKAGLIVESAGNLYGTTYSGGTGSCLFCGAFRRETNEDGANPEAGWVMDSVRNLYGTTVNGGTAGHGTVFKLDPTGHENRVVWLYGSKR